VPIRRLAGINANFVDNLQNIVWFVLPRDLHQPVIWHSKNA